MHECHSFVNCEVERDYRSILLSSLLFHFSLSLSFYLFMNLVEQSSVLLVQTMLQKFSENLIQTTEDSATVLYKTSSYGCIRVNLLHQEKQQDAVSGMDNIESESSLTHLTGHFLGESIIHFTKSIQVHDNAVVRIDLHHILRETTRILTGAIIHHLHHPVTTNIHSAVNTKA